MSHSSRHRVAGLRAAALATCLTALIGCGHGQPLQPLPPQALAPDFSLPDVNPNSATSNQFVSPRAQLSRVSAWYFGHAT